MSIPATVGDTVPFLFFAAAFNLMRNSSFINLFHGCPSCNCSNSTLYPLIVSAFNASNSISSKISESTEISLWSANIALTDAAVHKKSPS